VSFSLKTKKGCASQGSVCSLSGHHRDFQALISSLTSLYSSHILFLSRNFIYPFVS
jgi:hypothetical protein